MKKFAVIVAGGRGTRMNSDIPKQFLLLKNKPILYYTIKAFLDGCENIEIILVLPEEHIAQGTGNYRWIFRSITDTHNRRRKNPVSFCTKRTFANKRGKYHFCS